MNHNLHGKSLLTGLVLLALVLCCLLPAAAYEGEIQGSITVTLKPGHSLSLYRVGELRERDSGSYWGLTPEFAGSRLSLESLEGEKLPQSLLRWAELKDLESRTVTADSAGKLVFSDLQPGLYLLYQETAGAGYYPVKPFLVSLPQKGEVYEVNAQPKTQLVPKPAGPGTPTTPTGPKLPQTGQLNWPVPVLAVCGVLLVTAGRSLYRKGRDER